jgi:hypothetical protein
MTYGHSIRLPAENAAVKRALDRTHGTWGGYQAWKKLDVDCRLALVEQALTPANDVIDEFPVVL